MREAKNLNLFRDIRPTAIQPFPLPSLPWSAFMAPMTPQESWRETVKRLHSVRAVYAEPRPDGRLRCSEHRPPIS